MTTQEENNNNNTHVINRALVFKGITQDDENADVSNAEFKESFKYNYNYIKTHTLRECFEDLKNTYPILYENDDNLKKLSNIKLYILLREDLATVDVKSVTADVLKSKNEEYNFYNSKDINDILNNYKCF